MGIAARASPEGSKDSTGPLQPQIGNQFPLLVQNWSIAQWGEERHRKPTKGNLFDCLKITICIYLSFPVTRKASEHFNSTQKSIGPIEPDKWREGKRSFVLSSTLSAAASA